MSVKNFQSETKTLSLYGGEVQMTFSASGHRYQVIDKGVKVLGTLGCTTVLGVLDRPQLLQWAVNLSCEAFEEGLPIGTVIDEQNLQIVKKRASLAWREKRDQAGSTGTIVHELCQQYIEKRIEYEQKNATYKPEMPINDTVQQAFTKFLLWERQNVKRWIATEKVVYSRKQNCAGTLDCLYISLDDKLCLADIKTSKGIYPSFNYQVAFYKYAFNEEARSCNATPLLIEDMTIVRVGKDDGALEVKKVTDYEKNAKAFLACVILKRS